MHRNLPRLVLVLLAGVLLVGCATTGGGLGLDAGKGMDPEAAIVPLIDVAERKSALAKVQADKRVRWCVQSWPHPNFTREATISGPIEYQRSNAQTAGNSLFGLVEAYYTGRRRAAQDIRGALEKGARDGGFTRLIPYAPPEIPGYNVMNEPVYQVANFMVPLAHAYLILKEAYPEDTALLAGVRRWGNQLFQITSRANDDFLRPYGGADRRGLIAAGWAAWGNATENRTALAFAYRYYIHALTGTGKGGVDRIWIDVPPTGGTRLSFVNLTLGPALVAAHALHRSGASDVYTVAPAGGTLIDGLEWLWNEIEEKHPREILSRRHSGSRSIGWAELFIREFPEHPLAARMNDWLSDKRPQYVHHAGGPTTCLYHRIPPQT